MPFPPFRDEIDGRSVLSKTWPRQATPGSGNGGIFIELKDAVDQLAMRQDKFMEHIDAHFNRLADTLNVRMPSRESGAKEIRRSRHKEPDPTKEIDPTASLTLKSTTAGTTSNGNPSAASTPTKIIKSSCAADISIHHQRPSLKRMLTQSSSISWSVNVGVASLQLSSAAAPEDEKSDDAGWEEKFKHIVTGKVFEWMSVGVTLLNMMSLFVQLQLQSCEAARAFDFSELDCSWQNLKILFSVSEAMFNAWYLMEIILRLTAFRWGFFRDPINLVDVGVVSMALIQAASEHVQVQGVAPLRFLRLIRTIRVMRFIRVLDAFRELHILLRTLAASFCSLQWSACLLGSIVFSAGMLLMQIVNPFIHDNTQDLEIRKAMYKDFGSPLRAVYSIFVATFSAGWVPMAQQMIDHVSPFMACFWVLYIVIVNFAVIRVVSALFLKQTMDVASIDSERRAMQLQKDREKFARTLRQIFQRYDTSGDGKISREEFEHMIASHQVLGMFEKLNLEYEEVVALFGVLSSDDGCADYNEFLTGALKMKSSARTFDTIQIMHQLEHLRDSMCDIKNHLGVEGSDMEMLSESDMVCRSVEQNVFVACQ